MTLKETDADLRAHITWCERRLQLILWLLCAQMFMTILLTVYVGMSLFGP